MKHLILTLALLTCSLLGYAQKGISYQAIILDPNPIEIPGQDITGQPFVNGNVSLKFRIYSANLIQEFEEVHTTQTDAYGTVNVLIGSVSPSAFSSLVWDSKQKSLHVLVSFDQGGTYTKISEQQLTYNPLALFAETAGKLSETLSIAGGGTGATTAVAARTNLGLGNVDNTADAAKPISGATQNALDTKVDKVTGKQLSTNDFSTAEKTKLAAITGTNTGDQDLSAYATTTQLATKASASDVTNSLATKVDKEVGKGLSSNDYTTAEKNKLAAISGDGTGIQGPAGLPGATGAQGPQGLTGPAGASGLPGATGTNGKTVAYGTSNPTSSTGVDGDFYINTTTHTLFGPKASGAWPTGVSLVGPTGAQGPQGLTGATGAAGPQGIQGLTGATGPAGVAGPTGAQGPQGLTGADGPQGLTGATGPAGVAGATGAQGPQGLTGATGAAGAQGIQGLTGATGPAGVAGATGPTGATGPAPSGTGIVTVSSGTLQTPGTLTGDVTTTGAGLATSIATGAVTSDKLLDGTIATADVADAAITDAKIGGVAGSKVSGNISGNAANVTGTVAVANGGTGAATLASNNVLLGNGTSALQVVAPGASGNVLTSNGTTWSSAAAGVPYTGATGAVNLGAYNLTVNSLTIGQGGRSSNNNTAIGIGVLPSTTSGANNTGLGSNALAANTGDNNVGIGFQALKLNTSGGNNIAIGQNAANSNLTGSNNVAIGFQTAFWASASDNITAVGSMALNAEKGAGNTAIGVGAGKVGSGGPYINTTNSTFLGYNTTTGKTTDVTITNATAIGYGATVTASHNIQLGNTSVTNVNTSGALTTGAVTYPIVHGTANQVLTTTGSGTLTFTTPAVSKPISDQFTATAAQTSFTLTQTPITNTTVSPNVKPNVWMYINGIRTNNSAYTISGTTVTYNPANNNSYTLVAGDRIQFDYAY
jgi:hypothetical protein